MLREIAGVNHVDDINRVKDVDDLKVSTRFCLASDEEFAMRYSLRISAGRMLNDVLGLGCCNAVLRDVI